MDVNLGVNARPFQAHYHWAREDILATLPCRSSIIFDSTIDTLGDIIIYKFKHTHTEWQDRKPFSRTKARQKHRNTMLPWSERKIESTRLKRSPIPSSEKETLSEIMMMLRNDHSS